MSLIETKEYGHSQHEAALFDMYASAALTGLLFQEEGATDFKVLSKQAYEVAEAMIEARRNHLDNPSRPQGADSY